MKTKIKRTTALLLLAALLVTFLPFRSAATVTENTALKNLTDTYTSGTGSFTLTGQSRIFVVSVATGLSSELKQTAELISSEFKTQFSGKSWELPLVYGDESLALSGDIILAVDTTLNLGEEGYKLEITSGNCKVTGKDVDGLLYGAQMLLRHFMVYGGTEIPACTVTDAPDTKERTLMLDCARKYWSVDWIKNLIRQMSWMGYNTLELHMTEDQGIRMNIWVDRAGKKVADCNGNDFSWLPGYKAASWASSYPDPNADKQYNRDEIIEIVNLAKEYRIEIIPSVDFPGHSDYLISKYNSYRSEGKTVSFTYKNTTYTDSGSEQIYITNSGYGHQNDGNWGTIDFTKEYPKNLSLAITEAYAEFFKNLGCNKINIGADEVRGEAGRDFEYSTFVAYINEMCDMLQQKGYKVRAFNDYLDADSISSFDQELEICYWIHNSKNIQAFLNAGHTVYNCAQSYNYYVLRCNSTYGDARSETNTWWGFHHATEQRIYSGCNGNCNDSGCKHYTTGWNPSRITCNDESLLTCTDSKLGGGYFLIWGDWAGWNTEVQVWNGLAISSDNSTDPDDTNTNAGAAGINGGLYNLVDRMWSNSVKMWNWDIDESISYSDYWPLRNLYRLYPGFTGPSNAPSITASAALTEAPNFSVLAAALAKEPAQAKEDYTPASYSAWQTACTTAQEVYNNHLSTKAEVDTATANLNTAYNGLTLLTAEPACITLYAMVGNTAQEIEKIELQSGSFARLVSTPAGCRFSHVTGTVKAQPIFSGASAMLLTGTIYSDQPVCVFYQNVPDLSLLKRLLDSADSSAFKSPTYNEAVAKAKEFYDGNSSNPAANVTQAQVDAEVRNLLTARTTASYDSTDATGILDIRNTSDYVAVGKAAVIVVTTTPDVTSLTIDGVSFTECVAQPTTNAEGATVKVWYLRFQMDTAGTFDYTLSASGNQEVTKTFTVVSQ